MSTIAIQRHKHDKHNPFVAINTEVVRSLSVSQLGVLVKLLAFGDGWDVSDERLRKEYNIRPGESKRIRPELVTLGHLSVERPINAKSKKFNGPAQWQVVEKPQGHKSISGVVDTPKDDVKTEGENPQSHDAVSGIVESRNHDATIHSVESDDAHGENSTPLIPISINPSKPQESNLVVEKEKEKKRTSRKTAAPKPPDPDAADITAIISAWLKASHAIDPTAYARPINRDCARQMNHAGITADDVTAFVPVKAQDPFWKDKTVPFTTIAKDIGAWKASRAPKQAPQFFDPAPTLHTPPPEPIQTPEEKAAMLENIKRIHREIGSMTIQDKLATLTGKRG